VLGSRRRRQRDPFGDALPLPARTANACMRWS
jgi:hypothetical protein